MNRSIKILYFYKLYYSLKKRKYIYFTKRYSDEKQKKCNKDRIWKIVNNDFDRESPVIREYLLSFLYIQYYFAPNAHSFATSLLDSTALRFIHPFTLVFSTHQRQWSIWKILFTYHSASGTIINSLRFSIPRDSSITSITMERWWRWTSMKYRIIGISQSLLWDIDNLCQEIRWVRQDFPSRGTNWLLRQLRWWMYMGCICYCKFTYTKWYVA